MTTRKNRRQAQDRRRRAVGIVRISVGRENETSTATQEKAIRAWCDLHGYELVEVCVDRGKSAFKQNRTRRPGLRRARHLIEVGAADILVCWRIDRVARNAKDLLGLVDEIKEHGGTFASVCEQFDTSTGTGRAMLTIIGALAELESSIKSERTTAWQEHRLDNGAVPTGPRPFGYRRGRNTLTIDEAEAKMIRQAAADLLAGQSLRAALAAVNAAGGRDGKPLTAKSLTRILMSPTIAALRPLEATVVDWLRDRGPVVASDAWEPILDRDTWEKVGKLLSDPRRRTSPSVSRRWLLSGLLECGKAGCGKPMQIKSHPQGPRYQCPTEHLSIPAADTERVVEELILQRLDLTAWRRLRSRGTQPVNTAEREAELEDLLQRKESGEIEYFEYFRLRADLIARLEDAAAEPVRLPKVVDPVKAWPKMGVEGKRLIVTACLPRIVIGPAVPGRRFDATRIDTKWDPVVEDDEAA